MKAKPILTDDQIAQLIDEPKLVDVSLSRWMKPNKKRKKTRRERKILATTPTKNTFEVFVHYNISIPTNFGMKLSYLTQGHRYRLVRFDGFSGPHVNQLEHRRSPYRKVPMRTCHIHRMREDYLRHSLINTKIHEDGFAIKTEEFSNSAEAMDYFLSYCRIIYTGLKYESHNPLFEGA